MSSPAPSYVAYTPKRHSTQSSIASLSQLQQQQSPQVPSSAGAAPPSSSTSAAYHVRTGSLTRPSPHGNGHARGDSWLKQPQPRVGTTLDRPALIANQWTSASSFASNSSTSGLSRSPAQNSSSPFPNHRAVSPPSHSPIPPHTLPFSPSPRPPTESRSATPQGPPSPTKRPPSRPQSIPPGQTMPYLGTFQPLGVRADRTTEFAQARKRLRREKLGDEERLERRLDKLVELHFPSTDTNQSVPPPRLNRSSSSSSSLSSILNDPASSAKSLFRTSISNLATGTIAAGLAAAGTSSALEKEEQKLVKWQEDKLVKECQICSASFGLITRKHHCRLCGRIVCFLPPTPPPPPTPASPSLASNAASSATPGPPARKIVQRNERCSTFFTYISSAPTSSHRKGFSAMSEAKEFHRRTGIVVEVPPVEQDLSLDAVLGPPASRNSQQEQSQRIAATKQKPDQDEPRKKVRVCRDCLTVVLRNQLKNLPLDTPNWLKLYNVLIELEAEIDQSLVDFQELAFGLQNPESTRNGMPPSVSQTNALRARLLTNLASYDTLSKRLLSLSSTTSNSDREGGSKPGRRELERLQKALGTRATGWLGDKLALLRSLGSVEEISGKRSKPGNIRPDSNRDDDRAGDQTSTGPVKSLQSLLNEDELKKMRETVGQVGAGSTLDGATARSEQAQGEESPLQVLLEQERLVQSYLEDANARRQFEDAASLQMSLNELRKEIDLLSAH
ncbi:uncharacterized protein JCM15063_001430 [Sporobolomyces koalae]|uniref:uncharacterized protein n=1 Tax=Sporobolomyces koalae TaxID=500713 RepID=UPI00317570B1